LGASAKNLVTLLTGQFVKLLIASVVVAAPFGYWVMEKWLSGFSYRIDVSMVIILFSSVIVVFVAIVTVGVQALKASNMNPVDSLRSE
jgi:putative ABC transport system permease protein